MYSNYSTVAKKVMSLFLEYKHIFGFGGNSFKKLLSLKPLKFFDDQ